MANNYDGLSLPTKAGLMQLDKDLEGTVETTPTAPVISKQSVRPLGTGTPEQEAQRKLLFQKQEACAKALRAGGKCL
jgi:hypothetical protein